MISHHQQSFATFFPATQSRFEELASFLLQSSAITLHPTLNLPAPSRTQKGFSSLSFHGRQDVSKRTKLKEPKDEERENQQKQTHRLWEPAVTIQNQFQNENILPHSATQSGLFAF